MCALPCFANRPREQIRSSRLDRDAAPRILDHVHDLALGVCRDDHRASDGENTVHPARNDEPREPLDETDEMKIGRGKRLRQHLARLIRQEDHLVGAQAVSELDELGLPGTAPDHDEADVLEIAQEGGGAHEHVEVLRIAHIPRVHDDELVDQAVLAGPGVVLRARHQFVGIHPVSNHHDPLGCHALRDQPRLHRLADRNDAVGIAQSHADEQPESPDEHRVPQAAQFDRDLREDVLHDRHIRDAKAPCRNECECGHERRIAHAHDEIGGRSVSPSRSDDAT